MRSLPQLYYKEIQAHRANGVRKSFDAEVYFGIVDETAKGDSTLSASTQMPFSNISSLRQEAAVASRVYATFENGGFVLGGNHYIIPENGSYTYQTFTASSMSDETGAYVDIPYLDFKFRSAHTIAGLTLQFSENHSLPVSHIRVTAYKNGQQTHTHDIEDNTEYRVLDETTIEDFDRLKIEFLQGPKNTRPRFEFIEFGLGFRYTSNDIIALKQTKIAHPVGMQLPVNDVRFSVFNENNRFSVDDPKSLVGFLDRGLPIKVDYYYPLSSGETAHFNVEDITLDSWETKGTKTTFFGKDLLYRLSQSTFKKGIFDRQGRSLATLARMVLDDAGVTDYVLSTSLESDMTELPLPYASHAECLQHIAVAGRCLLVVDPNGTLYIQRTESITPAQWQHAFSPVATADLELPYSNAASAYKNAGEQHAYTTFEYAGFVLGSDQRIIPENENYLDSTGLHLNVLPDSSGNYRYNGYNIGFRVIFPQNYNFSKITIEFFQYSFVTDVLVTRRVNISGKLSTVAETHSVIDNKCEIMGDYSNVYEISVAVTKASEAKRYQIKRILIDDVGIDLTKDDVLNLTNAAILPKCKNINVAHYAVWFWPTTNPNEELQKATIPPNELVEIQHNEVYYDVVASTTTSGATIVSQTHYARCSFVRVSGSASNVEVVLSGKRYASTTKSTKTISLNADGEEITIDNPIIRWPSQAQNTGRWAAEYYATQKQYQIETLGYPDIDALDNCTFENLPRVVLENVIDVNGTTMRGKMKLRGE